MRKIAVVQLTDEQRADLNRRLEHQALTGRQRRRHHILLLADQGLTDEQIAQATGAGLSTVGRLRKRWGAEGLEAALAEKPRCGAPAQWDGKQQALMVALACSDAPEGHAHWSARLLANRAVEREVVESISESSVRRLLKKTRSSRGRNGRGASRKGPANSSPAGRTCGNGMRNRWRKPGRWSAGMN
jgi:transposase